MAKKFFIRYKLPFLCAVMERNYAASSNYLLRNKMQKHRRGKPLTCSLKTKIYTLERKCILGFFSSHTFAYFIYFCIVNKSNHCPFARRHKMRKQFPVECALVSNTQTLFSTTHTFVSEPQLKQTEARFQVGLCCLPHS